MSKCCHPVQTAQREAKTMPSTPAGYWPLQPHMDPSHTKHDWWHSATPLPHHQLPLLFQLQYFSLCSKSTALVLSGFDSVRCQPPIAVVLVEYDATLVPAPVVVFVQHVNSPCTVRLWFCQMPASHCSQWGSGSVRCQPLIAVNAVLVRSDASLSLQSMRFWFSQMPASHCSQSGSGSVRCYTLAAVNVIPHVLSSFLKSKQNDMPTGLTYNQHHCY